MEMGQADLDQLSDLDYHDPSTHNTKYDRFRPREWEFI
jgi:hypothetical protein